MDNKRKAIVFNPIDKLARQIIGDLKRSQLIPKGYELIGYLSFMLSYELRNNCEHEYLPYPHELSVFNPDLCALAMPIIKRCYKCGEIE
jgi:hypothetical protein